MSDLISRQDAIDAINHICPIDTEYDCTLLDRVNVRCVLSELPTKEITQEDVEAYCRDRCLVVITAELFECFKRGLPSAQQEIITCKDCKYWHKEIHNGIEYFNFSSCDLNHYGDGHNFYCADAERKEE